MTDQTDVAFDSYALRMPSIPHRLPIVERIMTESIIDPRIEQHRPRALFTFFCGSEPESLGGYDSQLEVVGRCLEWFTFDYLIPELGCTPAEHWLNCNASKLNTRENKAVEQCLDFTLGIFEITAVTPDVGFTAIDILRPGKSYAISEKIITGELENGQILLGRLFPSEDIMTISGMSAIVDKAAAGQMKRLFQSGKLKPKSILENLDGLELENLIGRSLMGIDTIEDLAILDKRLGRYFGDVVPGIMSFEKFQHFVEQADDPVEIAVRVCRHMHISCSHEIELILAYIMTYWFRTH
ncbi:MAG: hypothetical protein K9M57_08725 [Phycisphaerae bacterium]|nr:hypothetical protein [Phycisphaerae bacterium]